MKLKLHTQFEEVLNWMRKVVKNYENDDVIDTPPIILSIEDSEIQKYNQIISTFSEFEKIIIGTLIVDKLSDYFTHNKVNILFTTITPTVKLISVYGASWDHTYECERLHMIERGTPWDETNFNKKYDVIASTKEYQYSLFLLDYMTDGKREVNVDFIVKYIPNVDVSSKEYINAYTLSIIYASLSAHKNYKDIEKYVINLIADKLGIQNYKQWCRQHTIAEFIQ